MIPPALEKEIQKQLSDHTGKNITLFAPSPLGGGSINRAFRLRTSAGDFFLKYNLKETYPGMFEKEARGLRLLRQTKTIGIPEVIATGHSDTHSFLLLEYLEAGKEVREYWEDFALNLARLHRYSTESFGLDHDNYIGSLPQHNASHSRWVDFFIEQRLEVQLKRARDKGMADAALCKSFERLYLRLPQILPEEKPSLLHGDLWSGNYLPGPEGRACLIDPAVYYGHREMDIAMSKLFGGFHFRFYAAYDQAWPMQPGWQGRMDICNLYPLMVHVNLFGGGYLGDVKRILKGV
jgi:fructosamine-3-kinase